MRRGARGQRRRGVSILELMICLVIFSGVIITFATVFPAGFRLTGQGLAVNKAGTLANGVLEEIKALPMADGPFLGQGLTGAPAASQLFTICSLARVDSGGSLQAGWGQDTSTVATTKTTVATFATSTSTVNFPRTSVTVGDPTQNSNAPTTGDASIFFLPLKGDNLTSNGVPQIGIVVQPSVVNLLTGAILAVPPPANQNPAPNSAQMTNDILMATIYVTVGYREAVTGHQGGGSGTTGLKFVTVSSQVTQNVLQ